MAPVGATPATCQDPGTTQHCGPQCFFQLRGTLESACTCILIVRCTRSSFCGFRHFVNRAEDAGNMGCHFTYRRKDSTHRVPDHEGLRDRTRMIGVCVCHKHRLRCKVKVLYISSGLVGSGSTCPTVTTVTTVTTTTPSWILDPGSWILF